MNKVKTDCFAYDDYVCKCRALKELYCKKEECKFYKPRRGGSQKPCTTYKP